MSNNKNNQTLKTLTWLKNNIEKMANKITSMWAITKIIISIWLSFLIIKTTYVQTLFIYNQADVDKILIYVWLLAFILYFILDQLISLLKSE